MTEVEGLPANRPATWVRITYRKDFYGGGHIIGRTVVPAGVAFEVYDDGEAF